MNIRVFTTNNAGKIEFTKCELEKLLNNTYAEGFENGMAVANTHPAAPTAPFVCNDNAPECVAETKKPDVKSVTVSGEFDPKILHEIFSMPLGRAYPNEAIANLAKELGL
jgi:hypothetical protein